MIIPYDLNIRTKELGIGIGIGLAVGSALTMLFQGQTGILGNLNTLITTISAVIGTSVLVIDRFLNWHNQPALEIVGIFDSLQWIPSKTTFDAYFLDHYYLRIRNAKRKGAAEACKANLVIPNSSLGNIPMHWRHTKESTTIDISTMQDLRLFTTSEGLDKIFFTLPTLEGEYMAPIGEKEQSYKEFIYKNLEVHFGSKTGRFIQNPYRKKIADIIKESKREH
jgi:hypothetical protein